MEEKKWWENFPGLIRVKFVQAPAGIINDRAHGIIFSCGGGGGGGVMYIFILMCLVKCITGNYTQVVLDLFDNVGIYFSSLHLCFDKVSHISAL